MTDAQEILKLIEEVDPNDTAKLDEIDARVWCYALGHDYVDHKGDHYLKYERNESPFCTVTAVNLPAIKYTRSRDALKAIRPKGWYICIQQTIEAVPKWMVTLGKTKVYATDKHIELRSYITRPTEELAELHAIIRAIEWDRSQ